MRAFALAVLGSVALLGACSGKVDNGDDMSNGGGAGKASKAAPPPTPEAQCIAYASTWCNKSFGCYVQDGRLDQRLSHR